jgi:hypothetical protein
MKGRLAAIFLAGFMILLSGCQQEYGRTAIPLTHQWRLNRECAVAGRALWDTPLNNASEPRPPTIEAFYSSRIDTCVQVEVDELRMSYDIRDVTHGFMRDHLLSEFDPYVFHCGREGADSAILSKVREFHGLVADKTYGLWQDNGDGGLPATIKTPDHPYSRDDCKHLLKKKLDEL